MELEGERQQAVPRQILSREQAGDPSRPTSPGVMGGTALLGRGWGGVGGCEPKAPRGWEKTVGGVTICPRLSGTEGFKGVGLSVLKLREFSKSSYYNT